MYTEQDECPAQLAVEDADLAVICLSTLFIEGGSNFALQPVEIVARDVSRRFVLWTGQRALCEHDVHEQTAEE